jgi:hypothetical protein
MADNKLPRYVVTARENIPLKEEINSDGFDGNDIPEVKIRYKTLGTEKRVFGKYNCHIVLGRDRPGNLSANRQAQEDDPFAKKTGYGGNGFTNCSAIDIVAGVGGIDPSYTDGSRKRVVSVGPDFAKDAARIYVSQKTDLDKDFEIGSLANMAGQSRITIPAVAASGIGLKADHIRIIARKEMKLVTGTDARNSKGEEILMVGGISLIAANDERDVQPLVKGDNLIEFLGKTVGKIDELAGLVNNLVDIVRELGQELVTHNHASPFFGAPTSPPQNLVGLNTSTKAINMTVQEMIAFKRTLPNLKDNHLKPVGKGYINSRLNSTN